MNTRTWQIAAAILFVICTAQAQDKTEIFELQLQVRKLELRITALEARPYIILPEPTVFSTSDSCSMGLHPYTEQHPRVTPYMISHDSLAHGCDWRWFVTAKNDTSYYLIR